VKWNKEHVLQGFRNIARFVAALLFLAVGGTMNFMFASTLGTDDVSRLVWQLLSVSASLYTLLGFDLIDENWPKHRGRAYAAAVLLLCSLAYDGLSAYGFATRQTSVTSGATGEETRRRQDAERDVAAAERNLAPYENAPDQDVAQRDVRSIQLELEEIDAIPGIKINGVPCGNAPGRKVMIEHCPRRLDAAARLRGAEGALARAEAKTKWTAKLAGARAALNRIPPPAPADARTLLLGPALVEWLPVALLMVGTLFGFYVIPPADQQRAARPRWKLTAWLMRRPAPAAVSPPVTHAPAVPSAQAKTRRAQRGSEKIAQRLSEIDKTSLPEGVTATHDGWIAGPQRTLAAAAGIPSTTLFHRLLHDAHAAGELDLDTSSKVTRIRVRV
jgi:hypothetical protein